MNHARQTLAAEEFGGIPEIISHLSAKGYLINEHRRAFIQAVFTLKQFSSAEELWLYLKQNDHQVSIATVYMTLKIFVREYLLVKSPGEGRLSRYELIKK